MNLEPGLYEHEVEWLSKSTNRNFQYAHEATNMLWNILEKLDRGETDIKGEVRIALSDLSYLMGNLEGLKDYYYQEPPASDTPLPPPRRREPTLGDRAKQAIFGKGVRI